TGPAGPTGTGAMPRSIPAWRKPSAAHGPLSSIAAFFDENRVSASAPVWPTGLTWLFATRPAQVFRAPTLAAELMVALPSEPTMSPLFIHCRIGHIWMVEWSASEMPYWVGLAPPRVSFFASATNSSCVLGASVMPAVVNIALL